MTDSYDWEVARKVEAFAKSVKDSNPHWICTPAGTYETNNGSDWCRDCGYFMLRHLRRKDRKRAGDYFFDGGWRVESDTHGFCAHCGCWLRTSLTDYGVEEELAHYRENGVGFDANDAYAISLLLDAVSGGDKRTDEVMAIAREFLANNECQTCDGTGKEARHQICRDCDETIRVHPDQTSPMTVGPEAFLDEPAT